MLSPDLIDRRHFATQLAVGASALTAAMTPLAAVSAAEDQPAEKQRPWLSCPQRRWCCSPI